MKLLRWLVGLCVLPGISPAQADIRGQSASVICGGAVSYARGVEPTWDTSAKYAMFSAEARRRGYTLAHCIAVLTGPVPAPPVADPAA